MFAGAAALSGRRAAYLPAGCVHIHALTKPILDSHIRSSIVTVMTDGTVTEGALHRYRICEVEDREGRRGRPKRTTVISWDNVTDAQLDVLRKLNEPRLGPNQIAELNGRIIARGADVTQADVEDSETTVPRPLRSDLPTDVMEFAHRMCWDIYERDIAASLELRKQTQALNERAMEQGKKMDAMIADLAAARADMLRQQPAAAQAEKSITLADVTNLVQTSLVLVHEISKGTGPQSS